MKLVFVSLLSLMVAVGCNDQKKRLADERNVEYQKRLSQKRAQTLGQKKTVIAEDPTATQDNNGPQLGQTKDLGEAADSGHNNNSTTATLEQPDAAGPQTSEKTMTPPPPTLIDGSAGKPVTSTVTTTNEQAEKEKAAAEANAKAAAEAKAKAEADAKAKAEADKKAAADKKTVEDKAQAEAKAKSEAKADADAKAKQATQAEQKPPQQQEAASAQQQAVAQESQQDKSAKQTADGTYGPEFLSYPEYATVISLMKEMFKDNFEAIMTRKNADKTQFKVTTNDNKISIQLHQAGKVIIDLKDITLEPTRGLEGESNGYQYLGGCYNQDCSLAFITIYKVGKDSKSIEFNCPIVMKKVNGQYVGAKTKSNEDYRKEYETLKAQAEASKGAPAAAPAKTQTSEGSVGTN